MSSTDGAELTTLSTLMSAAWHSPSNTAPPAEAKVATAGTTATAAATPASAAFMPLEQLLPPREHDAASLLQALAIKDALLRQLEATLLLRPLQQRASTAPHSRRVGRREAVLAHKVEALGAEQQLFRRREACAFALNQRLRQEVEAAALRQGAAREELQFLRVRHAVACVRNEELQSELEDSRREVDALCASSSAHTAQARRLERELRDEAAFYCRIAEQAMHELGSPALWDTATARRSESGRREG